MTWSSNYLTKILKITGNLIPQKNKLNNELSDHEREKVTTAEKNTKMKIVRNFMFLYDGREGYTYDKN